MYNKRAGLSDLDGSNGRVKIGAEDEDGIYHHELVAALQGGNGAKGRARVEDVVHVHATALA